MAYQTYTTEALVCGSRNNNTSDRAYLLFTQEVGMIWATARSVREERSKQRYALQDFSLIRVSLVKGKSGWRIGSVEAEGNPFMQARSRSERAHVKNTIALIRRYIHGEQSVAGAFADAKEVLEMSRESQLFDVVGLLFTARLLHELGYISKSIHTTTMFQSKTLAEALLAYDPTIEGELTKLIEQAHNLSHL